MEQVDSPLTNAKAKLVGTIDAEAIIRGYSDTYGIDVSRYFKMVPTVNIFECQASAYRFYHPLTLTGQSDLYEQLQQFTWNYKADKWEYQRALSFVRAENVLLDVGCGEGAFLKLAREKGATVSGLEFNSDAVAIARANNLNVNKQTIGEHRSAASQQYDIVTCFQVLEHIENVRAFLDECVASIRPGGIFIVGVPNNDSFLQFDNNAVLNMPPHHMGLWRRQSLEYIGKLFSLETISISNEPLAEADWFTAVMIRRWLPNPILKSIYYKLRLDRPTTLLVSIMSPYIAGHTILAVFRKPV